MQKKTLYIIIAIVVIAALALLWPTISRLIGNKDKYPSRDVTITVPWNPGGITDLVTRALADGLSKELGVNFTITNTPGAAGSVGTINVQNSAKNGYNLLGNGLQAFVTYPVMGYTDVTWRDWDIYTLAYAPNVIAVRADSPYQTLEDLIADCKARPDKVTVGTAGPGSGGHTGIEILSTAAGFTYKHVPYEGGNPAIIATLSGEVDFNTQLLTEVIDMVRSGEMRILACMSDKPLQIVDGPLIPSVLDTLPELDKVVPMGETIGFLVPKGCPENVLKALDTAVPKVLASNDFKSFVDTKGLVVRSNPRADGQEYVKNLASIVTWTLYNTGAAKKSPADFDIPNPFK